MAALTVALAEEVVSGYSGPAVCAVDHGHYGEPKVMPKADHAAWPKVEEVAATILFWRRRHRASPAAPSYRSGRCEQFSISRRHHVAGRRLDQARHRAGGNDGVLLGVGLVVPLDVLEIVEVVHHQAV